MRPHLFVAPAGSGKTTYAVVQARRQARHLGATPYVLVASALQAQAFRRRLARAGGAIGVRVLTFEQLYRICLNTTETVYSKVNHSVQHRIIRAVVRELPLVHYAPLAGRPGFIHVLKGIIDELKAARLHPEALAEAVAADSHPSRLRELADIYAAYQARLKAEGWTDAAGVGWLAVQALQESAGQDAGDWPPLLVDGFDDFTPVQLTLLASLVTRVERMVITLTGTLDSGTRALAHRRFDRTRREVEEMLAVEAEPLPAARSDREGVLNHLETNLFQATAPRIASDGSVELIETANRAGEVRAALRWLKAEIVEGGMRPGQLALLARDVTPYRSLIGQIAAEFGLPVHIYAGQPLAQNPAVAALLDLLRAMLPVEREGRDGTEPGEIIPTLRPQSLVDSWRSPYFDWSAWSTVGPSDAGVSRTPIGIQPGDADALGLVARRGRVIAGLDQWEEAFEALKGIEDDESAAETEEIEERDDSPRRLTSHRVQELHGRFSRFVERLSPPAGRQTARTFTRWLETLIGIDPQGGSGRFSQQESQSGLDVIARVREAEGSGDKRSSLAAQDIAALRSLKQVLQGLVWAEDALHDPPLTFPRFLDELISGVEATFYGVPRQLDRDEILVADVVAARGVSFKAVAALGLAEGSFPATQSENPLLWDADRESLRLPLRPSTESAEAEYFYETMAAPSRRILLTRPRLTDDGAPWQASPFWEEVQRLTAVEPIRLTGTSADGPDRAASWPELLQSACGSPLDQRLWDWLRNHSPTSVTALDAAVQILTCRQTGSATPFDGDLHGLQEHFEHAFGAGCTWSASRLEAYRTCPFHFLVGKVWALEPREEPAEGIDWLQRGNLYHEILERVYEAVDDPTDLDQLLSALPAVARWVLDEAPERQGFRKTAWWAETRKELVEDLRRSLEALHQDEQRGDFVPVASEAAFGLWGKPPLVVPDPSSADAFALRGVIDRVDQDAQGRVRIIDYKTAGPSRYRDSALRNGEKIQLPLYALAARDALRLGEPVSGFYWHVRHAEPSPFKLEDFGPEEAMRTAVGHAWEAIHSARKGHFAPHPPSGGCPSYCPAVGFCWHFQRGYQG